jgi:hypothetical protein
MALSYGTTHSVSYQYATTQHGTTQYGANALRHCIRGRTTHGHTPYPGSTSVTMAMLHMSSLPFPACMPPQRVTGRPPLSWTIVPSFDKSYPRPVRAMLDYALGEYRRIPLYAAADKSFCMMPADYPPAMLAALESVEAVAK